MNKTWIAAGIWNALSATIHTIVGNYSLIVPFMDTEFETVLKAILHSCWHMVTVMLIMSPIVLLLIGIMPARWASGQIAFLVGLYYVFAAIVFVIVGAYYGSFLWQSISLLGIGLLAFTGIKTDGRSIQPAAEETNRT